MQAMNNPIDTLDARLLQAQAAILAIQNCWDHQEKDFTLPPNYLHAALWAAEELLAQGLEALKAMEESQSSAHMAIAA
jgi:hypothetical protein